MPFETYLIESKYKNVNSTADNIKEFCLANGIAENQCSDLLICIIEALNNVITHSYKKVDTNQIEISISINGNDFIVEIIDQGISRTNFEKPTLDFDPYDIENLPEGGMGLFIIDNLMDSNNYRSENGKNIFTMIKKLNQ